VTLQQLVKQAKANEQLFQQRVRKVIRGSYSNHYRRMLPKLLGALRFRCSNTAYRPVMDPLELLERYLEVPGQQRFYPPDEPVDGVVPAEWREAVVDEQGKVERIPYELCVLRALRDAIRRREIYIEGARRWRDPDEDLPADFEHNRELINATRREVDFLGRGTASAVCLDTDAPREYPGGLQPGYCTRVLRVPEDEAADSGFSGREFTPTCGSPLMVNDG
jgi:hypothetical protein